MPLLIVDKTAKNFDKKIEHTFSVKTLENIQFEMITTYSSLVQQERLRGYSSIIGAVINYINLHLTTPLTIDKLAAHVKRNPKYLSTIFKKEVGVGIKEYINSARIRQSLPLLRNTDHVISHIAMLVGFNDANYFTKVFVKEMGCTPTKYRENNNII